LHLNTDEFYLDYVNDPVLKERMDFVDSIASSKNDLISLAGFCLIEGSVLYSSFSYLKHFQSNGKNKLPNLVRGIDFSVRDEDLHSLVGAWSFKSLKSQLQLKASHEDALLDDIIEILNFSKTAMSTILMNNHSKVRLNVSLKQHQCIYRLLVMM
jgi:ribonucleotide reductase beta subunit family protein with ferritin-like domain